MEGAHLVVFLDELAIHHHGEAIWSQRGVKRWIEVQVGQEDRGTEVGFVVVATASIPVSARPAATRLVSLQTRWRAILGKH